MNATIKDQTFIKGTLYFNLFHNEILKHIFLRKVYRERYILTLVDPNHKNLSAWLH